MSTIAHTASDVQHYQAARFERAVIRFGLGLARWGRRRAARRPAPLSVPEHRVAAVAAADRAAHAQFWMR